eukprot:4186017-Amphidinium_carterae.1
MLYESKKKETWLMEKARTQKEHGTEENRVTISIQSSLDTEIYRAALSMASMPLESSCFIVCTKKFLCQKLRAASVIVLVGAAAFATSCDPVDPRVRAVEMGRTGKEDRMRATCPSATPAVPTSDTTASIAASVTSAFMASTIIAYGEPHSLRKHNPPIILQMSNIVEWKLRGVDWQLARWSDEAPG